MRSAAQAKWEALSDTEKAALASAAFEDGCWLIAIDFSAVGEVLADQGMLKQRGDRWALTPTGHNIRARRPRQG